MSVGSTPSKDRARSLIDGDHAVGGRRRASCHVANVVGAGAPNELVALVATQWWRRCGCRCGRRAAWTLSRINIRVVPPPTVRGLQDAPILVGPENQVSISIFSDSNLNPQ